MLKPRRIKGEQISAIVTSYLRKRQYTQDGGEPGQKRDKSDQGVEEMALSRAVTMETGLAQYLSLSSTSGDPSLCDQQYAKLRAMLAEAVEPYRSELTPLLYPLFVHVYLELLCNGHKTPAHKFYSRHHAVFRDSGPAQDAVLDALQTMYSRDDVTACPSVSEFREHRYSVNLAEDSFLYLLRYLKTEESALLLQIFNTHFDLRVGGDVVPCESRGAHSDGGQQMAPASPPVTPENKVIHNEAVLSSLQRSIQRVRAGVPSLPSVCVYTAQPHGITCAALSSDHSQLVTGSEDSMLRLWSRSTAPLTVHPSTVNTSHVHLSGDHPGDIARKHSVAMETPQETALLRGHCGAIYSAQYTCDNNFILSASEDKTVRLWDLSTQTSRAVYRGHNYPVWSLDTSPLGPYFVTGSHDRTAKIWMTDRTYPLRTLMGHLGDVHVVRFHPNNVYIASGSSDRVVRLWSVQDGAPVRLLQGHKAAVYALAFSPDGRRLASAGEDRRIRIWDLGTGTLYKELRGHTDIVYSLNYNPESTVLVSGGMDGVLRVWNVEGDSTPPSTTTATPPTPANQELVSPELLASYPVRGLTIHHAEYTRPNLVTAVAAHSS